MDSFFTVRSLIHLEFVLAIGMKQKLIFSKLLSSWPQVIYFLSPYFPKQREFEAQKLVLWAKDELRSQIGANGTTQRLVTTGNHYQPWAKVSKGERNVPEAQGLGHQEKTKVMAVCPMRSEVFQKMHLLPKLRGEGRNAPLLPSSNFPSVVSTGQT